MFKALTVIFFVLFLLQTFRVYSCRKKTANLLERLHGLFSLYDRVRKLRGGKE